SPRARHKILNESGRMIGEVSSGTFSPGLQAGIGMGFIEKNENILAKKIVFGDDKSACPGKIVKRPFYTGTSLKN
ncbi:MAG: glycine cleavage system aminomethyltransferase GcvT, partial [Candidatus Omnitrophica bacterium]|nr:glycine cleavage system aminomethyltransferase GcvT [Candidatus Omnitrophota bacterium]